MVTIGFLRRAGLLEVGLPQIQKSEFYFFFAFFFLTYGVTNLLKVAICGVHVAESLLTGLVFTFHCACGS